MKNRKVSVKRTAELGIARRRDRVSESSGRLAKTRRMEATWTDSERQTETQKQRENRKERGSHTVTQHL